MQTIFQPYSADPVDAINSVSRAGLNLTLLEAAGAEPNVDLRFDLRCLDVHLDVPAAEFEGPGGKRERLDADVIFGTDGAFSGVRGAMQITDRFDYSQSYLEHGYKELEIPPTADIPGGATPGGADGFAMAPNALHIWPRGGSMMIALPNPDRSFTCTLFWPFEGDHGFSAINPDSDDAILDFFRRHYPDAARLMPTLIRDYRANPVSSLVTIRCQPWNHGGKALILGDAAHAIVPFFGQGMNAAFEDVRILGEMLEADGLDFGAILPAFSAQRKAHADAIADMALENFIEMRDKVGRPEFLYHKRVEQALHRLRADRVTPLYNLVSFSNVPYAEARRRGRALDRLVDRLVDQLPAHEAERLGAQAWLARLDELAGSLLAAAEPTRG